MSSPNNLDESLNVNSSMENIKYQDVRYLKEENYLPTFKNQWKKIKTKNDWWIYAFQVYNFF